MEAMKGANRNVHFFEKQSDVIKYVRELVSSEKYIVITMGAGDVYKIGDELKINS
jgi:UDP-N-acetylmuramate-alanine ligase